jgi:hypothetical protein
MKLSYRGISYEPKSIMLEVTEGEVGGKYRGKNWQYHYPRHIPPIQPKLFLQYRGVAYSTRALPIQQNVTHSNIQEQDTFCRLPIKKITTSVEEDLKSIHLENLRRNLERRLEVAKERGDEYLVNLLEKESQQLALNC